MKRHLGIVAVAALSGMFAAGAVQSLFSAFAVQNELVPPTSGIYSGVQYSQKIGDAFKSLAGCNKGSSAPANVEGSAVDGLCWIDDTSTPWIVKQYVNGSWVVTGALDPTNSLYAGVMGGGIGTIASTTTTDLNSVPQANVSITGTTTISGFGSGAPEGIVKIIRFAGALTLTNSAALTIPGGFDLVTAANDRAVVTHLGSGNWEITQYTRASGIPVDVSRVGKISYDQSVTVSALEVAGYGQALARSSYPAFFAKTVRVQNGTRTSGNATIASVANTLGLGVGMPVEATGINAGCTIASIVANTSITLNSSSCVTSSGTSALTVLPYGYGSGGDATTIGVADCRNRVMAGRDRPDPGTYSNRLSASYFGAASDVFNAAGGLENVTMALANLYQHNHAVFLNDPGHSHGAASGFFLNSSPNSSVFGPGSNGSFQGATASATTGITVRDATGGGGTANQTANTGSTSPTPMRTVQPTLIAECTVRVTP